MSKVVIFGASDHARYTIDIIEQENVNEIVGIIDSNLIKGSDFAGYQILGTEEDLSELMLEYGIDGGIIAIGSNFTRLKVYNKILSLVKSFRFISAVHPSVIIGKNVKIGNGTLIMAGCIVNNDSVIGENCFLATKTSIDHDSILKDFSSTSPGVTTGGKVSIGFCSAIGLGANILHYKEVGDNTVIGAGSLVTKNIGSNIVAYGSPAKIIRERNNEDKYL